MMDVALAKSLLLIRNMYTDCVSLDMQPSSVTKLAIKPTESQFVSIDYLSRTESLTKSCDDEQDAPSSHMANAECLFEEIPP